MTATLERGFKSWAERTAAGLREDLGISEEQPLDPHQLAAYFQVGVCIPKEIPGLPKDVLKQLLETDPWGWSATSIVKRDTALVIYKPRHSRARQTSDIMHELAHIILGHQPATMICPRMVKWSCGVTTRSRKTRPIGTPALYFCRGRRFFGVVEPKWPPERLLCCMESARISSFLEFE